MNEDAPALRRWIPRSRRSTGVLAKALSRESEQRFRTAEEFAQAIETLQPVSRLVVAARLGKAVKQYAAASLRRDKKLIDDAVLALSLSRRRRSAFASNRDLRALGGVVRRRVGRGRSACRRWTACSRTRPCRVAQPGAGRAQPGAPVPPPPLGDNPFDVADALELEVPVGLSSQKPPSPRGAPGCSCCS